MGRNQNGHGGALRIFLLLILPLAHCFNFSRGIPGFTQNQRKGESLCAFNSVASSNIKVWHYFSNTCSCCVVCVCMVYAAYADAGLLTKYIHV
jgi:hypothetical protein